MQDTRPKTRTRARSGSSHRTTGEQSPDAPPASVSSPRSSRSSAWMARRPRHARPRAPARRGSGALYRHVRTKNSSTILSSTPCSPRSTAGQNPLCPRSRRFCARAPAAGGPGGSFRHRRPAEDRDPISPASLALAEAFLAALQAAGLPGRQAALAFRLIYDYTLGFALAGLASPAEQRLGDSATRQQLHAFLRSLPASSSPPWPRAAHTPGPTTARNASPRASTPSCAACRQPSAHPNPATRPDQIKVLR